jgi:hypothetical protein
MDEENIIKHIHIKNYIKIFLLKKNIFTKIKINYTDSKKRNNNNFSTNNNNNKIDISKKLYLTNTTLLNYIIHYYPELNYKINKTSVTISTNNDLNLNAKVQFKSCQTNILKNNPCSNIISRSNSTSNINTKINYNIIIGFNQEKETINSTLKLKTPLNLINIKCNSKNKEKEQLVSELTTKIEKLLKNNKYIKKYIAYVIVE